MDDGAKRYISRAIDLAAEREDELTDEELAAIAADLGLSPEDLARVDQVIEDHIERGRGYARHEMWDDAIDELEEALTLAPRRIDATAELADAYLGRFEATDYTDDKQRARELARRCLQLDPTYEPAFDLLARIDGEAPARASTPSRKNSAGKRQIIAFTSAMVVFIGALGAFLAVRKPAPPVESPPVTDEPTPPSPPEQPAETGERELDVEFVQHEGLSFEPLRARLAVYPENAFFRLWGDLGVTGDIEVERVDLKLSLLDEDGEVVTADSWEAWAGHEATLRRGDHGFFEHLTRADGRAESARLEVSLVEKSPAGGEYEAAQPIEVKWEIPRPDHVALVFAEREHRFSANELMEGGFVHATWELRNEGESPIRTLKYEVRMVDGRGETLEVKTRLATFSSHPPIRPGDVFLESIIAQVPESYDRYELSIIELE